MSRASIVTFAVLRVAVVVCATIVLGVIVGTVASDLHSRECSEDCQHEALVLDAERQVDTGRDPGLEILAHELPKGYAHAAVARPLEGPVPSWQERARDSWLPPCKKACVYNEAHEEEAEEARQTCRRVGDHDPMCQDAFRELFGKEDACWSACLEREGDR